MSRFDTVGMTYLDDSGEVLTSGYMNFFETGTSTPKTTYSDAAKTTANAADVPLSAAGRAPNIFFDGLAKVIIYDANDVQIDEADPVSGQGDVQFATVALAKVASIDDGIRLSTTAYRTRGDGGHATYLVKTAAQASADGDIIDEYGNHTMGNGNVMILLVSGAVNIRQYGVMGSEATNLAAITAAGAAHLDLYAPESSAAYEFSGRIEYTRPVNISGAGVGKTVFESANQSIILINCTSYASTIVLKDFTFQTAATTGASTAITVSMSGVTYTDAAVRSLIIKDVEITGTPYAGLYLGNHNNAIVDGLLFSGYTDGSSSTNIESGKVIYLDSGTNTVIKNCKVRQASKFVDVGIGAVNTVIRDNSGEFLFEAVDTNSVDTGAIRGNNFKVGSIGIDAGNCDDWDISGNTIDVDPLYTTEAVKQIQMRGTSRAYDNTLQDTSGGTKNKIGFYNISSNAGKYPVIGHNTYIGLANSVSLGASAVNFKIAPGAHIDVTTPLVIDNDATDIQYPNKATTIVSDTSRSLSNATAQVFTFDAVLSGKGWYFDVAEPTRLTADIDGFYRVNATVFYTTANSGARESEIRLNGSFVAGWPRATCTGASAMVGTLNLNSRPIWLTAGDYIELFNEQASGGSITMPAGETYMTLEFVSDSPEAT